MKSERQRLDAVTRMAWIRLGFGVAQITGATAGVVLLWQTGTSVATLLAVGLTLLVSLTSRWVFRRWGN